MELAPASMVHFSECAYLLHLGHSVPTSVSNILLLLLWSTYPPPSGCMVLTFDRASAGKGSWGSDRSDDRRRRRSPLCTRNNLPRLHSDSNHTRNLLRLRAGARARDHSVHSIRDNLPI